MALKRTFLKGLGLNDEQIEAVIEAHAETVDGLKADVNKYKGDAEKLPNVQRELDELKATNSGDWQKKASDWEKKYNDLVADNKTKETRAAKEKAFREILKDANLNEKGVAKAIKYADWDSMELDEEGALKNAKEHIKTAKEEWSEYVVSVKKKGADTGDPPGNSGGSVKTKEEIYKMENGRYVLSASERQAELAKLYQSEKGE